MKVKRSSHPAFVKGMNPIATRKRTPAPTAAAIVDKTRKSGHAKVIKSS